MSSKDLILQKIQKNKPGKADLPEIPDFKPDETNLTEAFREALKANSGNSIILKDIEELIRLIGDQYPAGSKICSLVSGVQGNVDHASVTDPHNFKDLDLVVLKGELAVAENAAIWLSETTLVHRVLPFITQHLIIVVDRKDLVANMHQAYGKIKIDNDGYGVFIAGPSKTADIEQTLVIGAHGSRSLLVALV